MRTAQEISDFILSLGIDKHTYEGDSVVKRMFSMRPKWSYKNFIAILNSFGERQKLLEFGLLVGNGYSFLYNGQAVVLVGEALFGGSPLVRMFKQEESAESLSLEDLLIFDKKGTKNFQVYVLSEQDRHGLEASNWETTIRNYAEYMHANDGYPLKFIIRMRKNERQGQGGLILIERPNIGSLSKEFYLSLPYRRVDEESTFASVYPELKGVTLLEFSMNPYKYRDNLPSVYRDVKEQLDMWSFLRSVEF